MIEKIENLNDLKRRLESSYETYSQHGNSDTLSSWKNYLDQNPDQIDFCVNVLLNKEKEKQLAVLGKREMHRSNSEPFLRDTSRNLTAEILLHLISNVEDKEYFEARKRHAEAIQKELEELGLLNEHLSDNELADPENVQDEGVRKNVKKFNEFVAKLPHPILQSKRLPILLRHLSRIDLTNINWVDKIFVLISMSNIRNYSEQEKTLQENKRLVERFLQPNKISEKRIKDNLMFLVEYQKLKTRYPKNDKAEKRFARFFLWHCKKEDLDPKAAAERYHSFLHQHGL
ncbi:MAG: hypothetical protein SFW07_01135, partial [Gammaproteobacteria bacterium]|nr:hypothetical protein [Gammaproteobacteria bacterium]